MRTLLLFGVLFVFHLFAQSSVWKISDGKYTLYVGGTIHLLRSSDYPLPLEFDEAYAQADYVVFETDLAAATGEKFHHLLTQKMMLPPSQKLSDRLSPKTYAQLKAYIDAQGYSVELFERMRPWAVMLTLSQLKLSASGIDESGVDSYFDRRCRGDYKPKRSLETVEEQIGLITRIGEGEEDALIRQTLRDMKELPSMIEWMVSDWRDGKTERLNNELVDQMRIESPKMYESVLKRRNEAWMPQLLHMLHEEKRGFVLVGMMHLLGKDGVLQKFLQMGYAVEYLDTPKH